MSKVILLGRKMFVPLPTAVPGFCLPIQCAVTPIQKDVITSFWMGVTSHRWVKQNPEMLPEEEETLMG
jgi:hypothetical protein